MRHHYGGRIIAKWGKETDYKLILANGRANANGIAHCSAVKVQALHCKGVGEQH
jgi:hypothetical protein